MDTSSFITVTIELGVGLQGHTLLSSDKLKSL